MSSPDEFKRIPFNIKIYVPAALSYVIVVVVAIQLLGHADALLDQVSVLQHASVEAQAKDLPEQLIEMQGTVNQDKALINWLWFAVVFGGILIGISVSQVHRLFNLTLRAVAKKLQGAARDVAGISAEVSSSCTNLAEGASEQAASIEQTSASLEELTSMAKQNTQHVHSAKARANDARVTAEAGAKDMQGMTQVMDSMQVAGKELDRSMEEIKQSGNAISKIIKTIDEIAFQTNILALNAAVEAARAGEAGMGFAVVADEVRNLARRSADAARETSSLIENSITKSDQGVQMSQRVSSSLKQIIESSRLVDKRLQEIVGQVREVDSFMNQVTVSSQEQSVGVEQIAQAVTQMDQVTQSSAASSEEAAGAAAELNVQSGVLQSSVEELLSLIGASGPDTPSPVFHRPESAPKTSPALAHQKTSLNKPPTRPMVQLKSTRVPKSAPSPAEKNRAIPMDDFKDF
jgi:methyl-accepting chemotaxis protein